MHGMIIICSYYTNTTAYCSSSPLGEIYMPRLRTLVVSNLYYQEGTAI